MGVPWTVGKRALGGEPRTWPVYLYVNRAEKDNAWLGEAINLVFHFLDKTREAMPSF